MSLYYAGYRELTWFDESRQKEILTAMWYPAYQPEDDVTYLAHFHSKAAHEADFIEATFPLVIISHGSRGHRYNQYYLAEALAREGYIVVAIEHAGDTAFDDHLSENPLNHLNRMNDILFLYQKIKHSSFLNKYICWQRVAHIGHSFGGLSSYVLAGGLSSLISLELSKAALSEFQAALKGIVMLAPALSETLVASSEKLAVPALLITASDDECLGLSPEQYLPFFRQIQFITYPQTGHFVFLMPCPEAVAQQCPEAAEGQGVPRALIHSKLNQAIKNFLDDNL